MGQDAGDSVREIACDESGSEGEKLVGGSTEVFAHASVDLPQSVCADCIAEIRLVARSPATEVKASVVLREQNRRLLEWLLGPGGPLLGHGHVHLTEKAYLVTVRMLGVLAGADGALELHGTAPRTFGPGPWREVLAAFNDLMRTRSDRALAAALLARRLGALPPATDGLGDVVARLRAAADGLGGGSAVPGLDLDPLVPALVAAVRHWSRPGAPIRVVHDVQAALTPARLAQVTAACGPRLADLRFADSMSDPRVQVADLLAGAARWIASEALHGRAGDGLVALLRPYVDPRSVWGDRASWSQISMTDLR